MDLGYYLGLDLRTALTVAVSTTVLYFVFVAVLARSGQRLLSAPSSLELAVMTVLGAVVGRSLLGPAPTLGGGLLAITMLIGLEWFSGRVRSAQKREASAHRKDRQRSVALVVAGRPDHAALHRHRVDDVLLWSVLRGAGVRNLGEVSLLVFERTGRFSVLRTGEPIHPAALSGVRHANEVLERLVAGGATASPGPADPPEPGRA